MKSNDNSFEVHHITLPFPPTDMKADFEMEVYARFMRHLRQVCNSRSDIRVLSSIQFVADMMDVSDALISKILVDLGLRAPRMAFPEAYLEFADNTLMREIHQSGSASLCLRELQNHWAETGDDRFAAFKRLYPTLSVGVFAGV